jgi:hypothetical protein
MLHEFGCNKASANAPLGYSLDNDSICDGGRHCSPEYQPVNKLWVGPPSAHPAQSQDEIVFGPGV